MADRIKLIYQLNHLVHNLKATKARSSFILSENLNLMIYKYLPTDYLELYEENESQSYPAEYELYKEFKEKEIVRHEHERWLAQERQKKTDRHMAGNLALTFLFRDQDLHEIIKFRGGAEGGQNAAAEG